MRTQSYAQEVEEKLSSSRYSLRLPKICLWSLTVLLRFYVSLLSLLVNDHFILAVPYSSNYSWGQFIVDLFSISFIVCLHSCSAVGLSLQCLLGILFLLSLAWLLGLEKLFEDSFGSLRALLERSQILISSWESCHKPCGCWVIARASIHGTHDEALLDNIGFRFFCTVLWKENHFWAIVLASVRTHKIFCKEVFTVY